MPHELWPAFEAVLAGYDMLYIGKLEGSAADGVVATNAIERAWLGLGNCVKKILRLLRVLFEPGLIVQRFVRHTSR